MNVIYPWDWKWSVKIFAVCVDRKSLPWYVDFFSTSPRGDNFIDVGKFSG